MFKNSQAKKPEIYEEKKGSCGAGTHQPKKESNKVLRVRCWIFNTLLYVSKEVMEGFLNDII